MRITNSILQRTTLAGIQQNLREIKDATDRAVSGTRIRAASDDPGNAGSILRTDGQIRALEQYRRNIGAARSRLITEEGVLESSTDLLARAREIALRESSGVANETTRDIARKEVEQLLETMVQLGNTRLDGLYLFGGEAADLPPFHSESYQIREFGSNGSHETEVAAGQLVYTNHSADEIFDAEDRSAIRALRELFEALGTNHSNTAQEIGAAGQAAGAALDHIQTITADVGARMVRLDIAEANIEALDVNLQVFRSDLADVEFEEALTELIGRQTALQSAFVVTSRILQFTLTDYLR